MKKSFCIILLFIIVLASGCKKNEVDSKDLNEIIIEFGDIENKFDSIQITLPEAWYIKNDYKMMFSIMGDKGDKKGDIWFYEYSKGFDLKAQQPNHSEVTNYEEFDLPIGKVELMTLDVDNGSAASGIVGTHDEYYASISVAGKGIYLLTFNNNDKSETSKDLFISILESIKTQGIAADM